MFYLTPQERKFVVLVIIIFMAGAVVQLSFKRDIAPMRWARHAREFKINVNTARAEELQMLPGIGAKLAARIVAGRPFRSLDDLLDVDGITEKKFDHIKGLIEL